MDTDNPATEPAEQVSQDPVDRIAALLGGQEETQEEQDTQDTQEPAEQPAPEDSTEPEPESQDQPELVEVEFEGKTHKVPQELKDALLRQADYTRKTQEVAEARKVVEQVWQQGQQYAQLAQSVGPLMGQFQALAQRLQQYQQPEVQQRWAQLQQADPLTYFAERDEQRKVEQALMQTHGQLQAATAQMQQAEAQRLANLTQEGAKALASRIPDWNADKRQALSQYAEREFGFTQQELSSVVDPRMVMVLHKAHQFDQLQAKQPQVAKQVRQAPPKVVKSNPATDPKSGPQLNQAAMQRLKRSGGLEDATSAIASLLS